SKISLKASLIAGNCKGWRSRRSPLLESAPPASSSTTHGSSRSCTPLCASVMSPPPTASPQPSSTLRFATPSARPPVATPSPRCATSGRGVDRCELFAEAGFDEVRVGGDQRVLGRKVLVDPVRSLFGGFELVEVGDQPLPQRRRLLGLEKGPRGARELLGAAAGGGGSRLPFLCHQSGSQSRGYAVFVSDAGLVGRLRFRVFGEIRRIEIVLTCDTDKREEGIASCVGERRPHPSRRRRLGNRADRPFRRQPLPRRMGERGGEADQSPLVVDRR